MRHRERSIGRGYTVRWGPDWCDYCWSLLFLVSVFCLTQQLLHTAPALTTGAPFFDLQ